MLEMREVNLELGMPTVQTALSQLTMELRRTRSMGCTALKIIHGYGSSGKGGKIRVQARSRLAKMKGAGEIRDVIPGEEFSIFNSATWRLSPAAALCARTRTWSGTTTE